MALPCWSGEITKISPLTRNRYSRYACRGLFGDRIDRDKARVVLSATGRPPHATGCPRTIPAHTASRLHPIRTPSARGQQSRELARVRGWSRPERSFGQADSARLHGQLRVRQKCTLGNEFPPGWVSLAAGRLCGRLKREQKPPNRARSNVFYTSGPQITRGRSVIGRAAHAPARVKSRVHASFRVHRRARLEVAPIASTHTSGRSTAQPGGHLTRWTRRCRQYGRPQ